MRGEWGTKDIVRRLGGGDDIRDLKDMHAVMHASIRDILSIVKLSSGVTLHDDARKVRRGEREEHSPKDFSNEPHRLESDKKRRAFGLLALSLVA